MPSSPGTFSASWTSPGRARPTPGTPTTTPSRRSAGTPVASTSRGTTASQMSSTPLTSAPPCSWSSRPATLPSRSHTAMRRKRAPMSMPSTSAASAHRLEEERAVAGPVAVARRLAHEARLEQRLQGERHGRLGDADPAGDLGARDRSRLADRLEHGALVQISQERRRGGGGAACILVRKPNLSGVSVTFRSPRGWSGSRPRSRASRSARSCAGTTRVNGASSSHGGSGRRHVAPGSDRDERRAARAQLVLELLDIVLERPARMEDERRRRARHRRGRAVAEVGRREALRPDRRRSPSA